ncbi:MAG: dethiobiotin synthase [Gammaproteobacteria bacterium]
MTSPGFFITGTDTDVGKTVVSRALVARLVDHGLRVAALKPISAGCERTPEGLRNDDALQLMAAANVSLPYDTVNPFAYEPPIAPHIAAQRADRPMDIARCVGTLNEARSQADLCIVEGAGGWLVPINAQDTLEDLALALGLPVVLVVGIRLGCLNHAQLSARVIEASGLPLVGWIANHLSAETAEAEANVQALVDRIDAPLLETVPFEPDPGHAGAQASRYLLKALSH